MESGDRPEKPDRVAELIGVSVFLTVFGTSFVFVRMWVRYASIKSFGWDDIFIFLSMVCVSRFRLVFGASGTDSLKIARRSFRARPNPRMRRPRVREIYVHARYARRRSGNEVLELCSFLQWHCDGALESWDRHIVAPD